MNFPSVTINGAPLPKEAMAFELQRLIKFHSEHMPQEQIQAQMPGIQKKAVEQAIGAHLLMAEANRLDLPVTEADIDARIAKIEEDLEGPAELQKRLDAQRTTLKQFRETSFTPVLVAGGKIEGGFANIPPAIRLQTDGGVVSARYVPTGTLLMVR